MTNYFELLDLAPAFDVDLPALDAAYFKAQQQYHPDRLAGKSAQDRVTAVQRSTDINQAYQALKNPLKRAQYLLHLQNIEVGSERDTLKPDQEILLEIMRWREAAEETSNTAKLAAELEEAYKNSLAIIANAYRNQAFNEMAQAVIRLGYIIKTREELNRKKS